MPLPTMMHNDNIVRQTRYRFGGYNHAPYCKDGETFDMLNMSSVDFPTIRPRDTRTIYNNSTFDVTIYDDFTYSFIKDQQSKNNIYMPYEANMGEFIKQGDTINIDAKGTYLNNSGSYVVENVTKYNKDSKSYTSIQVTVPSGKFAATDGDEENPKTAWFTGITKKPEQLTIKKDNVSITIASMGSGDALFFVTETGDFFYEGKYYGTLNNQFPKQFATTGSFIYILPDNAYFNIDSKALITEHKYVKLVQNGSISVEMTADDIRYDLDKRMNTFKVNDVVQIRLVTKTGSYDLKGIVKSIDDFIDGLMMVFTSDIFTDAGLNYDEVFPDTDMRDINYITISEAFPDLKYVCAGANRVWGCDDKTIFCTAFGKPFAWFEYNASNNGNDADSAWSITPFEGSGKFTGCTIYNDYPMFFKEDYVYKIYGDKASNFSVSANATAGVIEGGNKTIKAVDGALLYLSRKGVMTYSQGVAVSISDLFYETLTDGVAGTDGDRYILSCFNGVNYKNFVLNLRNKLWSIEDNTHFTDFTYFQGYLYGLDDNHNIVCMGDAPETPPAPIQNEGKIEESDMESFIEWGDHYCNSVSKKAVSKLFFRFSIDQNAEVEFLINYDSEKDKGQRVWHSMYKKTNTEAIKKTYTIPVIPRRCDHFKLKIKAKGDYRLYALSFEYYTGTVNF